MAADKKTFIRNAQKQVQKGQLDRAIASYKAILKIDAKDEKVHNALGDLYIRKNMKNEGIKEYLWVADYYEKDGFHLRSIAICQKILNLDPQLAAVRLKLADLYSQQRLPAEAKAQYLQVADYFDKKGNVEQALEVFGKIADLDPDNLRVRVRLGAMYEKQSLPSKAAGAYARAAEGHLKKKEPDKAAELLGKALRLAPDHLGARLVAAELHAGREEWDKVVEVLESLASGEAADAQVLKTFAGACLRTGRPADAIKALETARKSEPSSLPVKTLLGRAYLQGREFDKAFEIYSPMISDDLKENRLEAAEDLARELAQASPEDDKAQQRLLEVLQKKGDTEEVPGIYLKLAGIYQDRSLARNAAGALEKYLELKPDDQEAAARLEALVSGGSPPAAAPAEAAPTAAPAPSLEALDVEMIDIEGDDLAEMVSVEGDEAAAPPPAGVQEEGIHIEIEDEEEEVVFDSEEEPAAEEATVAEPAPGGESPGEAEAVPQAGAVTEAGTAAEPAEVPEIAAAADIDSGREEAAAAEAAAEAGGDEAAPAAAEKPPLDDQSFLALESERTVEEPTAEREGVQEPALEAEAAQVPAAGAEAVEEIDLEEVDLEEVSLASTAEPEIRGDSVAAEVEAVTAAEPKTVEPPAAPGAGGDLDFDISALQEEAGAPAPVIEVDAGGPAEEFEEFLAEADFYFQQGLLDEAQFLYEKLSKLAPDNSEIAERLTRFEREKAAAESPQAAEEALLLDDGISSLESDLDRALRDETKPAESGLKLTIGDEGGEEQPGEFSDFLTGLRKELDESIPSPEPATTDDEGLSGIFQEFREGLKEQLGEEDFETHYNLGIAYKEMGLMQEALGEFELSEKSESRRLDSISMIALCLKDMGRQSDAVNKLQEGLRLAPEGSDEQKGFLYDLGDVYEHIGHQGESLEIFGRLSALDPGYRDVAARVGRTSASKRSSDGDEGTDPSKRKKPKVSYL